MTKHCPTCTCVGVSARETCPTCIRSVRKLQWDPHAMAERLRAGELTMSDAAREIGTSRQGLDQVLRNHGERDACLEGLATRRADRRNKEQMRRDKRKRQYADRARTYPPQPKMSREFMLDSLRAVHKFLKLGDQGMPHKVYNEYRPKHLPSTATIVDNFGTWNDALRAAGLPVIPPNANRVYYRIPKSQALDDLKRFIVEYRAEHGRYARVSNMVYDDWARNKENHAVSRAHISKRYGWSNLLDEAMDELYGEPNEQEYDEPDAATGS